MKKIITISLLLVFVLAGCAGQNNNEQNENNVISQKQGIFNFERPKERVDISGIVKTVIGNEVTILKIERPEMPNSVGSENTDYKKDKNEKIKRSVSIKGMGMGGGMGTKLNTDKENDERIEKLKSMSTGEEKVIIPVGIKMLKSNDGEAVIATLDDIKKDQMLMIWINKDIIDKNIATFVMIK